MKNYHMYMARQEISPEVHENLLNLEVPKRAARPWIKYGALAACAALIVGVGVWKLAPAPAAPQNPAQSTGQFAADYTPLPGETDTAGPENAFVVNSPADGGKLMFPMIPAISYPDITGQAELDACRAYYEPGSFMETLDREDIQTIFWGPEGKPEAEHPKLEQGDLPWMLFWDGYTLHGSALYSGQGALKELTLYGEKDRAEFQLELCVGALPFTCYVDLNRGDVVSEFKGVEIAGWSKVYDRDGDDIIDYICGSEFMTENNIGVRFMSWNNGRAEDGLDGETLFNTLFVRQAIVGGLHLDHLAVNENVPAWREKEFSSLAQARQEADFVPYLPTEDLTGYGEFYGRLSYQEGRSNSLFVRWSRGYDDVEVAVYRDGYRSYNLVDPADAEAYDLRLYSIPWCDSVPDEYRETVSNPAFRAEDMSLAVVEARGIEKDTGGLNFDFDVLHPDGTLVAYRCDGMTAAQVWALVEPSL